MTQLVTNRELVELLADIGGVLVDRNRVIAWTPDERTEVLTWLQTPTLDRAPACLFHVPAPEIARTPAKRREKKAAKKRGRR